MNRLPIALIIASLLTGCAGADPSGAGGEDVGSTDAPFLAYFEAGPIHIYFPGATTHADITEEALWFLDEDVAEELGEYNEATDTGSTKADSSYHNDNCQLVSSFASVRARYDEAVIDVGAGDYDAAKKVLGTILHTAQDFYAHSNWVEAGQGADYTFNHPFEFPSVKAGDPLGSPFGSVVVLAKGAPDWSIKLPAHTRVPKVTTERGVVDGLITGTYDNGDGNSCLSTAAIPHGDVIHLATDKDDDQGTYLTKDVPGLPFRNEALDRAHWQTVSELCRLTRLVMLRRGKPTHDALISAWVTDRDAYRRSCGEPNRNVEALMVASVW